MQCRSPRASAGFKRFEASIAPSALPAPTSVCISSMNRITPPSAAVTSLSTPFSRSSNSPRYLAPAISVPMSSDISFLSRSDSGTSPLTMRSARPSTMAVLPTPGSPISTGLFLVRLDSTCIVRRISSSRPITGSSLPAFAASVRSRVYFFRASYWFSALAELAVRPLRRSLIAALRVCGVTPALAKIFAASAPFSSASATSRRSTVTNELLAFSAIFSALSNSRAVVGAR